MIRGAILFLCLNSCLLSAQLRVCSWNVCDLGQSKSEAELRFMAGILKEYDIVALQEIVAGPEGPKAVAKLADELARTGNRWAYTVSNPTQGDRQRKERYAFLWKPSEVSIKGNAWLEEHFAAEIEREPFLGTFVYLDKELTLVNFHAITKKLQPETEIKFFRYYPAKYPGHRLVFAGDFNCPETHSVFSPLKKAGFRAALIGTKTTLRQKCKGSCTASAFDNFFYDGGRARAEMPGANPFHERFASFPEARKISDHLPIYMTLYLN